MEELIRPNWHIAIVHFPIALLIAGTLIEVFSFLGWRRSSFRWAGRWLLLLGAILSVPTAFSGIFALQDVAPGGIEELRQTDPVAADRLWSHLLVNSLATVLSMVVTVVWIGCSDAWRTRLSLIFKILLVLAMAGVSIGAHQGGELVYSSALGVEQRPPASLPTTAAEYADAETFATLLGGAEQPHVLMAGLMMALACVALGWNIRAIAQDDDPSISEETHAANRIAAAFATESGDLRSLLATDTHGISVHHTPPVRSTKLWLLTFVLAVATVGGGLWILALGEGTWQPETLWTAISQPIDPETDPRLTRRLAHALAGGVLVLSTLMLAICARVRRKSRLALVIFAPPLILAMAAQVWLGILLLLDSPAGKLTAFTP